VPGQVRASLRVKSRWPDDRGSGEPTTELSLTRSDTTSGDATAEQRGVSTAPRRSSPRASCKAQVPRGVTPRPTRYHDPATARKLGDLERRAALPRLKLVEAEETAAGAGQPPVRDRIGARQLVDGADRAAQTLSHLRRDEVAAIRLLCGHRPDQDASTRRLAGIVELAAASCITLGPCRSACLSVEEAGLRSGGSLREELQSLPIVDSAALPHDVAKIDEIPGQHRDSTISQIQGFLAHFARGFMRVPACCLPWICPQRDSNPRYSLERAVTWAASRWGPAAE
jgi:hypothetical protein